MTKALILSLLVFATIFSGCESAPSYTQTTGPHVKPGLVVVPADQLKYYEGRKEGSDNPPPGWATTDVNAVQTQSQVTAIQFNRYPDPNNHNLMHEAHVVYRRDNSPQWRLQPGSADQQILVGPQMTEGRGELKPVQSQELESYLRDQRTSLSRQQEVMANVGKAMSELAQQQQELAREIAKMKAEWSAEKPGAKPADSEEGKISPGDAKAGPAKS